MAVSREIDQNDQRVVELARHRVTVLITDVTVNHCAPVRRVAHRGNLIWFGLTAEVQKREKGVGQQPADIFAVWRATGPRLREVFRRD